MSKNDKKYKTDYSFKTLDRKRRDRIIAMREFSSSYEYKMTGEKMAPQVKH